MANNIGVKDGSGNLKVVKTTEVGGVHVPHHIIAEMPLMTTSFGDLSVAQAHPSAQLDAVYGILPWSHTTAASGTGASAGANRDPAFVMISGTDAAGYASLFSRDIMRYRPGQGAQVVFTAVWPDAPVANSEQLAGVSNVSGEGFFFAQYGSSRGVLRRRGGRLDIHKLVLTVVAAGAETANVTLDGTLFPISIGNTTTQQNAHTIAATDFSSAGYTAFAVGSTVFFMATSVGPKAGAFSYSSSGSSAGTMSSSQTGVDHDSPEEFTQQSDWNVDTMDGDGDEENDSGHTLVWADINAFMILYGWLGAIGPLYYVYVATLRKFVLVHADLYASTVPHVEQPSMRFHMCSVNKGATTSQEIRGSSAGLFLNGIKNNFEQTLAKGNFRSNITNTADTYTAIVAIRNMEVFNDRPNMRGVNIMSIAGSVNTAQSVRFVLLKDPTPASPLLFDYESEGDSCAEISLTDTTVTGGSSKAELPVAKNFSGEKILEGLNINIRPGETYVLAAIADAGGTPDGTATINFNED